MDWKYLYLGLNIFAISVPFLRSFDPRANFSKKWPFFFPAMFITGAFFIAWDVLFTDHGIWGFNPRYLTGITIINLPLEEWLFFVTVPYACVFTYEAVIFFSKRDYLAKYAKFITWILIAFCVVMVIFYYDRWYTLTTFSFLGLFLLLHLFVFKADYLGKFYFSYLFILIGFFTVNGVLTGSFIEQEVVWYNDSENLGVRIGTVPFEDGFYGMLLILMNITIYEKLRKARTKHAV
ncbi:MAG: lycopene cyclase domain-containing protein [Bacteroidota bacterium]